MNENIDKVTIEQCFKEDEKICKFIHNFVKQWKKSIKQYYKNSFNIEKLLNKCIQNEEDSNMNFFYTLTYKGLSNLNKKLIIHVSIFLS